MATITTAPSPVRETIYPESDGKPMAENTKQYAWIEKIKGGCEALFAHNAEVFVAGDLFWYPVEGRPDINLAPDTLVAFGRPKGDRGSYRQWNEGGMAPQVVFEVLSPSYRPGEMLGKFLAYNRYGVEEYYIYDPDKFDFTVALRQNGQLEVVPFTGTFVSPRLGVRFELSAYSELEIYRPDGRRFLSFVETEQERARNEAAIAQAEEATAKAEEATAKAETARLQAEAKAERLALRLRELGVEVNGG